MKKKVLNFILLSLIVSIGFSCSGGDKPEKKVPKKVQAPQQNTNKPVATAKPNPPKSDFAPTIPSPYEGGKKMAKAKTIYIIDTINKKQTKDVPQPLVVKDFIELSGWAIDEAAKKPAKGIVFEIGNKFFQANYGNNRPDVAKSYNNKEFVKVGYSAKIAVDKLPKGTHEVKLHVLADNGTEVYHPRNAGNPKITVQ